MEDEVRDSWERFLNPALLRQNLIVASIFLAAFEILKDSIVDRIRSFYITGFDDTGFRIDPQYDAEVSGRNKSRVFASLSWLKDHDAIHDADVAAFERIRDCRNEIAHELPLIVTDGIREDQATLFSEMVRLLKKIETWWIVNVEIPTNPDFDGREVDEAGIVPGPLISLQLMVDIALGSEKDADWYYKQFKGLADGV